MNGLSNTGKAPRTTLPVRLSQPVDNAVDERAGADTCPRCGDLCVDAPLAPYGARRQLVRRCPSCGARLREGVTV